MDNLVVVGVVVSSIVWFFISLLVQKKNMTKSLVSALIFVVWYFVIYFVGGYLYSLFAKIHNPDVNRYTIGIGAVVLWFLFSLLFKNKSMDSAMKSTGIFAAHVVLVEIVLEVLKIMNVKF